MMLDNQIKWMFWAESLRAKKDQRQVIPQESWRTHNLGERKQR